MSREYKKRKRAESEAQTKQRITEAIMHLHPGDKRVLPDGRPCG